MSWMMRLKSIVKLEWPTRGCDYRGNRDGGSQQDEGDVGVAYRRPLLGMH